jgi:hypothetical protein
VTAAAGRLRSWHSTRAVLVAALMTALMAAPMAGSADAAPARTPLTPMTIGTMPPVAGFPVVLDGITTHTDAEGNARFAAVADERPLSTRVTLTDAVLTLDGRPVKASGNSVSDVRSRPLIRLDLSYQVDFRFTAVDSSPIDESAVDGITLRSTNGEVVDLRPDETPWLHGARAVQILGDTQVRDVGWSVQRVMYAGSNVVNAAQQAFLPADRQEVQLTLLSFGVDFQVTDAFFGFPQRGAIELRYPDSSSRRFPVDAAGDLHIPQLPRGEYTLTSIGPGPDMSRPLAISRAQRVDVAFYSWLDIGLVLGLLVTLAGGLAWWGRTRRRRAKAAVIDSAAPPVETAVDSDAPAVAGNPGAGSARTGTEDPGRSSTEPAEAASGSAR